jgi:hypothetical protein
MLRAFGCPVPLEEHLIVFWARLLNGVFDMSDRFQEWGISGDANGIRIIKAVRLEAAIFKTGALPSLYSKLRPICRVSTDTKQVSFNHSTSAPSSCWATQRCEVVDKITPADICEPQEVIARLRALSLELATVATLAGHVLGDTDKAHVEQMAKTIAVGEVVAA